MNWLSELISQPGYLQTVIILSIICAVGLLFGQIKYRGFSLGVTLVFFAGILLGDICKRCGIEYDHSMVALAQNFGLILFVYSLGLQVGPGFFPALKKGGIKLNLFGVLVLLLTTGFALLLGPLSGTSLPDTVGLLCGAVTNTPMLGGAQQTMLDMNPEQIEAANGMATACAVGYPFGVVGVLVTLAVMKLLFLRGNGKKKAQDEDSTYVAEFHVSNPAIFGKSIKEAVKLIDRPIIISRVWSQGIVAIPYGDTVLQKDDHVLAVINRSDIDKVNTLFGEQESKDWNRPDINWDSVDEGHLVSKHVLVTRKELNGVKLGSLHLRNSYHINITRINRAGIQLLAAPGTRLQLGDRLTVVGEISAIAKVGEILGNEEKALREPNLVALFIGLLLGVVLGAIPIFIPGLSTPVKLGIAGGPIIVGILMGAYGSRIHLSTYTTRSANLMLRQFGIVVYLACLGLGAGADFFDTVFNLQGLVWIAMSLAIAIVPTLICGFIGCKWFGMDFASSSGMICASMANPMALTYANSVIEGEEASEAYATVYPVSIFLRVISGQLIMILLA